MYINGKKLQIRDILRIVGCPMPTTIYTEDGVCPECGYQDPEGRDVPCPNCN